MSSFVPHKRLPVSPALKTGFKKPFSRKALGLLVTVFGFLSPALAIEAPAHFADIPAASPAAKYVEYLNARQIITGYQDNTFKPYKPVTRAEFAVMLAKSQNLQARPVGKPFRDISQKHWAGWAIQAVSQKGWLKGYPGGLFFPNRRINRAELYVVMAKVARSQTPDATSNPSQPMSPETIEQVLQTYRDAGQLPRWAKAPVAQTIQKGLLADEETPPQMLWPLVNANRSNVATVLAKLMNPEFSEVAQNPPETPKNESANAAAKAAKPQEPQVEAIHLQPYMERLVASSTSEPITPMPEPENRLPLPEPRQPVAPEQGQTQAKPAETSSATVASPTPGNLRSARSARSIVQHPVGLYFSNLENQPQDPDTMLGNPSVRYFRGPAIAQQAIEAILQGPTEAERQRGFFVDDEICRLSLAGIQLLPDGKAAVTLEAPSDFEFKTPIAPQRLEAQIRLTLQQFPGVRKTEISILGANHNKLWTSP